MSGYKPGVYNNLGGNTVIDRPCLGFFQLEELKAGAFLFK